MPEEGGGPRGLHIPQTDPQYAELLHNLKLWPLLTNPDWTTLTVATGVLEFFAPAHLIAGEGAANDDVDTVNGLKDGHWYMARPASDTVTITWKHGTGNLRVIGGADIICDDEEDIVFLYKARGISDVIIMPFATPGSAVDHGTLSGLGDDDHTHYAQNAVDELITGEWYFNQNLVADSIQIPRVLATIASGSIDLSSAGLGSSHIRVNPESGVADNLAGMVPDSSTTTDQLVIVEVNQSGHTITITHEDTEVVASRRIHTQDGNSIVLTGAANQRQTAGFIYNGTQGKWLELWRPPGQDANDHLEDHDHDGTPTQKLLAANTHETISGVTASEAAQGHVELATQAEANAGADTARVAPISVLPTLFQASKYIYAADTGAADAYAMAPTPAISAYAAGQFFMFRAANANTGASTLAVSGLATRSIVKHGGDALAANDIKAGQIVVVAYDSTSTNFEMVSQLGNAPHAEDHASRHARGAADDLVAEGIEVAALFIDDTDGTPVGDVKLKVLDETLEVKNAADSTYENIKALGVQIQQAAPVSAEDATRKDYVDALRISKTYMFEYPDEDMAVGDFIPQNAIRVPAAGEHGTIILGIGYARCETAGTGTNTILIRTSTTLTGTRTTRGTIDLDTAREANSADMSFTVSDGMYIWVECSAVGGTAPKDVSVQIDATEQVF